MRRSHWSFLKNKWFVIVVTCIGAIGLIMWIRSGTPVPVFDSVEVTSGDVREVVSVTGSISPVDKADLAFEKSGVIKSVSVAVGDMIKKGQILATLDNVVDRAALTSAQATLEDATRSLTPEEFSVQQTALVNAESSAINAAHDAFVKAQSVLFNYADGFFNNPQSANPTITIRTGSTILESSVNYDRLALSDMLTMWSNELMRPEIDPAQSIKDTSKHLLQVKDFMRKLSGIVNDLSPGNSGLSQSTITPYVTTVNTGLSVLNSTIDAVARAESDLSGARSNYNLKLSGNSAQSIAALAAKVAQAQAFVDQDTLVSPIDGIVTRADVHVGEFASVGKVVFSIQDNDLKIEARVPEADIAKIMLGNRASTTLDAYGSYVDFPTQVTKIDPAETILEGVPTYKVTLHFIEPDTRVRSGMTTNLDILTQERLGVIRVPYRALVTTATSTSVRRVSDDGVTYTYIPVVTGLKGSDGTVEIISGIKPGERVVTYIKQ